VRDQSTYDYAVIRVVPRVERGEFVNAGVIVSCQDSAYLVARIELDEERLLALDPALDLESVRRHLAAIESVCRGDVHSGPIGRMSRRERFDWLTAPRSTSIQTSAVHSGRCADIGNVVEHLLETMVRRPRGGSG
jgi:hypothetical protein